MFLYKKTFLFIYICFFNVIFYFCFICIYVYIFIFYSSASSVVSDILTNTM